MKAAFLIAFLLLVPIAFADPILEAKQAQLDSNAYKVLVQMNAIIGFAKNESINVDNLVKIKSDFEKKVSEALQTKTNEEFAKAHTELKALVKQFKDVVQDKLRDVLDLAKQVAQDEIGHQKETLQSKIHAAEEKKRAAIANALDMRIQQIQKHLEDEKKQGREPLSYKVLLEKYQKAKNNLNQSSLTLPDLGSAQGFFGFFSNMFGSIGSLKDNVIAKANEIKAKGGSG